MLKINKKQAQATARAGQATARAGQATARAGQAAIELAVFGAILVFILGTVIRTAVGNGYAQNQNFKAMRMAMLASWNGSKAANMARNSASVLFVQDRLSPDVNKYGDVDRNPFIAQGSGTFSYELLYPLDQTEIASNLPMMDVYINGQYFPFTTASYVTNTITRPAACPYAANSCQQNQCLRNQREWVGGTIDASQFATVVPVSTLDAATSATMTANGRAIFHELGNEGVISLVSGSGSSGYVNFTTVSSQFITWLESTFPGTSQTQVDQIQGILQNSQSKYKLFYTMQVNGTPQFITTPPASCSAKDDALCSTATMLDINGNPYTNSTGAMQFDLARTGDYATVDNKFPSGGSLRNYIAWQWGATQATSSTNIGLNPSSNEYPTYDIDGRMKEVTIYGFSLNSDGTPTVTYEDFQGGDIDGTWDTNSCGPKPGLQNSSQIFTFTKQGTYLLIKEGKLYNPETNQFVRSSNKKDTIDLIQRTIQLSNNTGRFCNGSTPQATVSGAANPVEVCIAPGSSDNCFSSQQNIKSTCFDQNDNIIFVRSRLEDLRGHFWMTDTSGQIGVH